MNNMKKLIFCILIILSLTSCKDFLNMPPKNVKVVYKMADVKEATSLLLFATTKTQLGNGYINDIAYYNGKRLHNPYNRYFAVCAAMCSDDLEMTNFVDLTNSEKNRGGNFFTDDYVEVSEWEGYAFSSKLWSDVFLNVGFMNSIMKDLSNVPDYNQTDAERISGEVRVMRAYYLLRLNRIFAPINLNDMGIPYNLDSDAFGTVARKKQTDLYKELISELMDVLEYTTVPKDSWNIFYNKKIIHAILAQTYLYKGMSCAKEDSDWQNAESHAKIARDGARIENTVEEQQELVWIPSDYVVNKPHPFCLLRIANLGDEGRGGHNNYAPWGNVNSIIQQRATDDLYEMYDDNDIRKEDYFKMYEGKPGIIKNKPMGSIDAANSSHILFRHSEMLLIEAEAMERQGKDARLLLNEFKTAKIKGYTGYTGDNVLEEILKERRKEFCFETDMRWLDMKRLGISYTRTIKNMETSDMEQVTLKSDDYRYNLPIPLDTELQWNNIIQNPGWISK